MAHNVIDTRWTCNGAQLVRHSWFSTSLICLPYRWLGLSASLVVQTPHAIGNSVWQLPPPTNSSYIHLMTFMHMMNDAKPSSFLPLFQFHTLLTMQNRKQGRAGLLFAVLLSHYIIACFYYLFRSFFQWQEHARACWSSLSLARIKCQPHSWQQALL